MIRVPLGCSVAFLGEFQQFYKNDLKAQTPLAAPLPPARAQHPPKPGHPKQTTCGRQRSEPAWLGDGWSSVVTFGVHSLNCHPGWVWFCLSLNPVASLASCQGFPRSGVSLMAGLRTSTDKRGGTPQAPSVEPKPSWGFSVALALLEGC